MKTYAISAFKSQALQLLQNLTQTKEELRITKRGKTIARVLPCDDEETPKPGKLADAFLYEEDIVSPLGAGMWESAK